MSVRLTQLSAAMTSAGYTTSPPDLERLARAANLSLRRVEILLGLNLARTSDPALAGHAHPDEETRLEGALGVSAGGLR